MSLKTASPHPTFKKTNKQKIVNKFMSCSTDVCHSLCNWAHSRKFHLHGQSQETGYEVRYRPGTYSGEMGESKQHVVLRMYLAHESLNDFWYFTPTQPRRSYQVKVQENQIINKSLVHISRPTTLMYMFEDTVNNKYNKAQPANDKQVSV